MSTEGHDEEPRRPGGSIRTSSRWWRVCTALITLSVGACCVAVLWLLMSDAAFPVLVLAGWALVMLGVLWSAIGLFGAIRYHHYRWLLLAPGAVVLTCALAWADIPRNIGWRVSSGSLEQLAAACDTSARGRYGVYTVTSVVNRDGGCLLYTAGGFIDPVGFAYFPHGVPRQGTPRYDGDVGYIPIEGSWYRFVQRF